MTNPDPRFPIGPDPEEAVIDAARRDALIAEIERLPAELRAAVDGLDSEGWETPYREGGWTLRQLVHHLADAHVNGYIRCRLGLTEETPTVKPYDQDRWAELPDVATIDPAVSLGILEGIHARWAALLRSLSEDDLRREVFHPEHGRRISLGEMLSSYAWHGRHHVAHVRTARERMGAAG